MLTLREEHRPRVLRIFGPKRDEFNRGVEKTYIMRNLMICTAHPILCG